MDKNLRYMPLLLGTALFGLQAQEAEAAKPVKKVERPNILWLTFEDKSASEFGCYGNVDVHTPITDSLAARGIQFMNAWSTAPQSSPARSSIITGCYAPTFGMDFHPYPFDTPSDIFFPQRLREAGYYCTNNWKTHYNSTEDDTACWDECDKKATYNSEKRGKDQPFFAVFNNHTTHMGRIRTHHIDGRRDYTQEGLYPSLLTLPPYLPDLPEVRSDYAGDLESVQDVDKWLGFFLEDLKARGLDEDTIIFFYSDHGGCLPRGKGYLYETGLQVPMVVYFPPKWEHLANGMKGQVDDLVNFIDLGPTVLSLAGVRPGKRYQGKALFGEYAAPEKREINFAFAANQLHHFMPVRAARDARFKYIRSYLPYRQFALRNYYQWGMPANKAWDKLVLGGHNTRPELEQPFLPHPVEMLFDLENDPYELHDLSADPAYAEKLADFREAMAEHIRETGDLGFFLPTTRASCNLYEKAHKRGFPLEKLYELVEKAGEGRLSDEPLFREALSSEIAEFRFWGAAGYAQLARTGVLKEAPEALVTLLGDEDAYVYSEAAYALAYLGQARDAVSRLLSPDHEPYRKVGYSALECLSLDPDMRPAIHEFLPELQAADAMLPHKKNEDAGLMVRGILVNLGELDIDVLHGPEAYRQGLKLNHGRRPNGPLPY